MKTRLLAVGIAIVLAALALTAAALARHSSTRAQTLVGTVGPGYTIGLQKNGKKLVRLQAGKYTFVLHDKSSIHGWSLDGPKGFAKDLTPVPFIGTKTVTLNLKAGKYKFYCPSHETLMFGHFSAVED
jgi:hypothetical protein